MDDEAIKQVYNQLQGEIEQLMDKKGLDFATMSKIMHQLTNEFDTVRKHRYP